MNLRARHRIQPGVFFAAGERPPSCWRLLLIDFRAGAAPQRAGAALERILNVLADLRGGRVRDLEGQPPKDAEATAGQFADLTALLAVGRALFDADRHDPPLTRSQRPDYVAYLPRGRALAGLPWAVAERPGEADIALQLTANCEAAVNCAAVEVWKLITDEALPLTIAASFSGFSRPDRRGWLDFHDGVSNLEADQRLAAIEALPDPAWMGGGTYLAFLRLGIDLATWRSLAPPEQELLVGRDKLSGAALRATRSDARGARVPVTPEPPEAGDELDWVDPPQTTDPLLEASHIHRANQSRASADAPGAWRMFRQGYDFLETLGPEAPLAGLNFVSFQRDLSVVQHVLHLPGWLGGVDFGGLAGDDRANPVDHGLVTVRAGGLYAVPPREAPFPGATLFAR